MQRETGIYKTIQAGGETYKAFLPAHLPPVPVLNLAPIQRLLEKATMSLGELNGMAVILPDLRLFLYQYIRKEALLSSQIEGTQSSLSDLLLHELDEAPGVPIVDVEEVSAYVAAMDYALRRLKDLPLSLRLLRETHEVLLSTGRGRDKQPGEFRTSQNWIGGSRPGNASYVPPPQETLMDHLGAFEKFLHDDTDSLPTLIKAGLAHVQFETIHPFLDGNGRLGRLLITLMLCEAGLLTEPILYLSLYLKRHRSTYYALLQEVREQGRWEVWLDFFLTGIHETCQAALSSSRQLRQLFEMDSQRVSQTGRSAPNTLRVLDAFMHQPILNVPVIQDKLRVAPNTVRSAIAQLETLGIVKELTGRERNRHYVYDAYLALLSEGTEPLPQ